MISETSIKEIKIIIQHTNDNNIGYYAHTTVNNIMERGEITPKQHQELKDLILKAYNKYHS